MTDDEKNKLIDHLIKENESTNESLNQARQSHFEQLSGKQKQFLDFTVKIGELSLIVGSAISPIIIASKAEINQPIFIFLAVLIYLFNGIIAIWRAKDIVEKQLDAYAPGAFHKLELDVLPMEFSANKIIVYPENQPLKDDYLKERLKFLDENAETSIPKNQVDFSLDIFSLNFVIASLLLVKIIWPFNVIIYWTIFLVVVLIVLSLIIKSYIEARERAIYGECNTEKLNEMKREHLEWQKENVFKIKK